MARTAAPEKSSFFVRSNYQSGAGKSEPDAVAGQEQAFKAAAHGLLAMIEQAFPRIAEGDEAEAALCEIWTSLLEIKGITARDPGIRMAADDLYEAAMALVAVKNAGPAVDFKRWRLLKEADLRLRVRLASAQPGIKIQQEGVH